MKKTIMWAVLCVGLSGSLWTGPARAEEDSGSVRELPAGTELPDGTVAGEVQALGYFEANEPELYAELKAIEPETMRKLYGKYFVWFQRVGNYRKRQKAEMIRQLKNDLMIHGLYEKLRKTSDPSAKAAIQSNLRKAVEDLFDSDLSMLEIELRNAKGALEEVKDEVEQLSQRVEQRRKSRAEIIDRRMKELVRE